MGSGKEGEHFGSSNNGGYGEGEESKGCPGE